MSDKVGITAGAFDLCHPGHLLFFGEAKKHCNHLIVMLHTDPTIDRPAKNKPIETSFERWVRLTSCRHVDEVIPYDTELDLENALKSLNWDVRFLGSDYVGKPFTADFLGKVKFLERNCSYSSTSLRERVRK